MSPSRCTLLHSPWRCLLCVPKQVLLGRLHDSLGDYDRAIRFYAAGKLVRAAPRISLPSPSLSLLRLVVSLAAAPHHR